MGTLIGMILGSGPRVGVQYRRRRRLRLGGLSRRVCGAG
jgi:hypothetical protein